MHSLVSSVFQCVLCEKMAIERDNDRVGFFICYRTKRVKMQIRRQKGLRDLTDWTLQSDACSYTGWWHSH